MQKALPFSSVPTRLYAIAALRCVFFFFSLYFLNLLVPLGTSLLILALAAATMVTLATLLAWQGLSTKGMGIGLGVFFLLYLVTTRAFTGLGNALLTNPLPSYSLATHLEMIFLIGTLAFTTTWLFWRKPWAATTEILVVVLIAISLLAAHRGFHLDLPRFVNTLSWQLHLSPLATLTALGATLAFLSAVYIWLIDTPLRARTSSAKICGEENVKRRAWKALGAGCFVLLLAFLAGFLVHERYAQVAFSRTANGVGEAGEEGLSPLGFHSALGSTNQPAALVRLDGDYVNNPFSPMLYLREAALSAFNGRELVIAGKRFDQDVHTTSPQETFTAEEDTALLYREPVSQAVFTLADHKTAFALDYPLSIRPLKNPEPDRFRSSFKVYSMAPGYPLEILTDKPVGSPAWTKTEWEHYLTPHPDKRYQEMAQRITRDGEAPIEKAQLILEHLSKNAIYTLTPNHDVEPQEDPVAPFLFGDLRGYCVHFAHAITYMLRSLGIPARIATGYLTDLSQAKDGHILLRMSDRHAWAEAYVEGFGWVPFDIQPEQVENHADTEVDQNLLEELMGLLSPHDEFLPDNLLEDEKGAGDDERSSFSLPSRERVVQSALLLIALGAALKLFLWLSWLIPAAAPIRAFRFHRALLAFLYDGGAKRRPGETRLEFSNRLQSNFPSSSLLRSSTLTTNQFRYFAESKKDFGPADFQALRRQELAEIKRFSRRKMILALFSPVAIWRFLSRTFW